MVLPAAPTHRRSVPSDAVGSPPRSLGGTAMEAATFLWSCAKLLPKQQQRQQHAVLAAGGKQPVPAPEAAVMQDALRWSAEMVLSQPQSASLSAAAMAAWGAAQLGLAQPHTQGLVELACRRLLDMLPPGGVLRLGSRDRDSAVMLLWAMGSSGYGSAQVASYLPIPARASAWQLVPGRVPASARRCLPARPMQPHQAPQCRPTHRPSLRAWRALTALLLPVRGARSWQAHHAAKCGTICRCS